jgi:plasmid stability protein
LIGRARRYGGLIGRYSRIAATFGMWVLRHRQPRKPGAIPEVIAFIAVIEYGVSLQQHEFSMATLTIRNLDAALKERLRVRAALHGHSMEAEVRRILQDTLKEPERPKAANLYQRIRARFAPLGGVDFDLPPREQAPDPPRFD